MRDKQIWEQKEEMQRLLDSVQRVKQENSTLTLEISDLKKQFRYDQSIYMRVKLNTVYAYEENEQHTRLLICLWRTAVVLKIESRIFARGVFQFFIQNF